MFDKPVKFVRMQHVLPQRKQFRLQVGGKRFARRAMFPSIGVARTIIMIIINIVYRIR